MLINLTFLFDKLFFFPGDVVAHPPVGDATILLLAASATVGAFFTTVFVPPEAPFS
jgi:hypothetical protein